MTSSRLALLRNKARHPVDDDEGTEAIPMSQEAEDALGETERGFHPQPAAAHEAPRATQESGVSRAAHQIAVEDDGSYVTEDDFIDPEIEPESRTTQAAPPGLFRDAPDEDISEDIQDISIPGTEEPSPVIEKPSVPVPQPVPEPEPEPDPEPVPAPQPETEEETRARLKPGRRPGAGGAKPGPKPAGATEPDDDQETEAAQVARPQARVQKAAQKDPGGAPLLGDRILKALAKNLIEAAKESEVSTNGIDYEDIEPLWDRISECIDQAF